MTGEDSDRTLRGNTQDLRSCRARERSALSNGWRRVAMDTPRSAECDNPHTATNAACLLLAACCAQQLLATRRNGRDKSGA